MKNRMIKGMTAPDFTFNTPWKQSLHIYDFLKKEKALLVFLRYMGCPLCQLKISELSRDIDHFKAANTNVFIVLQSQPEIIREMANGKEFPMILICDPDMHIFNLYKVYSGSIFGYITPNVIKKAIQAKRHGFKHGKKEGKELQRPAAFLINTDKIVTYAYYGKNVGDIPDNPTLKTIAGI